MEYVKNKLKTQDVPKEFVTTASIKGGLTLVHETTKRYDNIEFRKCTETKTSTFIHVKLYNILFGLYSKIKFAPTPLGMHV